MYKVKALKKDTTDMQDKKALITGDTVGIGKALREQTRTHRAM
ncbi:hypothetical protein [Hymenobacter algoricola]|uniref:Uncharacterized protein n=1 Tax=Hymenobacter algoricola TaxID=486267 RepID=A0ABP7MEI8_9BACT